MIGSKRCLSHRPARWRASWPVALAAALMVSLLGSSGAHAQDVARGRQVYQLCGACHGPAGEGNHLYNAPAIAGLQQWYVEAQLTKFQKGLRGFKPDDVEGLQMRPMARALVRETDVKAVSTFVAALKPARPPATLKGDPERGKAAYAICLACHGERAQGQQALNAPALAHQADWYLVSQIKKFRAGLRGTHPGDATGAQMRPMAMALADDQAVVDVVAYIRSLGQ